MKIRPWLLVVLLVVAFLFAADCSSEAIKPLTDEEQDRFIEIALNTTEAQRYMENENNYETEVGWVGLGDRGSVSIETHRFDYEEIADGNIPSDRLYFSESLTIHPHVYIRVGEPVRMFIGVAIDRVTGEVLNVELEPGRLSAGPEPTEEGHPEGMESLRWLTDDERAKVIDIALFKNKAAKYLPEYNHFEINLSWIAIVWDNSECSEYLGIKYDWETDPNLDLVSGEAEFYSRVVINFGEPLQWQVMAAINPDTGKVAYVEENPFRTGPAPPE